jgi:predicted  nucleic acid-binding Zn-ribbon protein
MNLKEEIIKIVQLQEIDKKIYNFKQEKDIKKPGLLEDLKQEFAQRKQGLSACEENLKQAQLNKKERELELAAKEENLRKNQGQLYQLKTNKEYQAKLSEIGSLKADISIEEEKIIKILDEVDDASKESQAKKEQLAQNEENFKNAEAKISDEIKDIEAQIINLEDKRKYYIKDLEPQILAKYEQLLKTRQGLALAQVVDSNCGSCYLKVTHQKINEIKMYKDLVLCENCVRVLYIPGDLKL